MKAHKAIRSLFIVCYILCLFSFPMTAFSQYMNNGSLEGELGDNEPPLNWNTDDTWSDPDLFDNYTTPNTNEVYEPVDGNIFCLFRARGANYNETWHGPYQREYIYQQLPQPLEAYGCFRFTAYLCTNPDYSVNDTEDPHVGYPLKFQIWGANLPRTQDTLLFESEPVSNTEWEEYQFDFTTGGTSYAYIFLTVMWDTVNIRPQAYNGMVLVDNMNLVQGVDQDPHIFDTLYYQGDNETFLSATIGTSHAWEPAEVFDNYLSRNVTMTSYSEDLTVLVTPASGCPYYENYHVILDCDTLYPGENNEVYNYYFKYEENIMLEATSGTSWSWEPQVSLTAYDVQAPRLTDFHEEFTVTITDKYTCEFTEVFNILLHCDTLFPGGSVVVMDTTVTHDTPLTLTPKYGSRTGNWAPADYLDCTNCDNPVATPPSSMSYSLECSDQFDCAHTEIFKIEIPLQVPNVITPNNDGDNDCFRIYGLPENTSLYIYDTQGKLIYESDKYSFESCWPADGLGSSIQAGNYWFALEHPLHGTLKTGFLLLKR